jgi:hypothetical protein
MQTASLPGALFIKTMGAMMPGPLADRETKFEQAANCCFI